MAAVIVNRYCKNCLTNIRRRHASVTKSLLHSTRSKEFEMESSSSTAAARSSSLFLRGSKTVSVSGLPRPTADALLSTRSVSVFLTAIVEMRLKGASIRVRALLDQYSPYSRISSSAVKSFKLHTTNIKDEGVVTVIIRTRTPSSTDIRCALRVHHNLFITTPKRSLPASVVKYFPSMDLAFL